MLINSVVRTYMELAKTNTARDWEEARLQIHRFWRLAVPTLLSYLESENLTQVELAAKSLILMRNEEIITAIIDLANHTDDPERKEIYRFILSKMNEQRTSPIPGRTCLGKARSDELFYRLIVPALQQLESQ